MAKKVVRKKIPVGTDEFATTKSIILKYLTDNLKIVVIGASVIGLFFISYIGWGIYCNQRDQKAADAFSAAIKIYEARVEATGTAPDTFKTMDDKHRAVINTFEALSKKYKRHSIGSIALLYTANAYLNMKVYDKAIELYSQLLTGKVEDPGLHGNINAYKLNPGILRDSALYGLANSYEEKGDVKKAIDSLLFLTSSKDSHLREMGLYALGGLYEKSNEKSKALETYQGLISDYPESSNILKIKEKVEGLKS